VAGGIAAGGKGDDGAVEVVDGAVPLAVDIDRSRGFGGHHGTSLWLEGVL